MLREKLRLLSPMPLLAPVMAPSPKAEAVIGDGAVTVGPQKETSGRRKLRAQQPAIETTGGRLLPFLVEIYVPEFSLPTVMYGMELSFLCVR